MHSMNFFSLDNKYMNIQCLIIWEVNTPYHGPINVNAPDEEEAKVKAMLFIEETPMDKIHKTTIDDLTVSERPTVIQACII